MTKFILCDKYDKPLPDGGNWLHGADGTWWRQAYPEEFDTEAQAQMVMSMSGLICFIKQLPEEQPEGRHDDAPLAQA